MFNVCPECGGWTPDKKVDYQRAIAACPQCDAEIPVQLQPLFILTGASGAGKSATCMALMGRLTEVVVLEADILWFDYFHDPEKWSLLFDLWLRMCKNIGQSGRPVLLCGAGMGVPANLQASVEHRYFSTIHYLALTCDDATLTERLKARPAWRGIDDDFIKSQLEFNNWFKTEGPQQEPPIALLDTTDITVQESVRQVEEWVAQQLMKNTS